MYIMKNKAIFIGSVFAVMIAALFSASAYADGSDSSKYIFHAKGTVEIPPGTLLDGTLITDTTAPVKLHVIVEKFTNGTTNLLVGKYTTPVYLENAEDVIIKNMFLNPDTFNFILEGTGDQSTVSLFSTTLLSSSVHVERTLNMTGILDHQKDNGRMVFSVNGTIDAPDQDPKSLVLQGSFISLETVQNRRG